ncbi:hypothetical protein WJX77_000946 [Trebouxia sp. C0004]
MTPLYDRFDWASGVLASQRCKGQKQFLVQWAPTPCRVRHIPLHIELGYKGGACYEEERELWQRVKAAEQTASEALAELHTHKDAAAHATFELKEVKKASAARHAEAAAVRSALREVQSNSPSSQPLSHMQADMAQLRSMLSLVQSAVHWCEAECSGLQNHNQSLSHQLACSASHLTIAHTRLSCTDMAGSANTCQKLSCASRTQNVLDAVRALAGQIPAYKLDMMLRQLTNVRYHNDTLAQQLEVMSQRLLAAEQAKDESDIKLHPTENSQPSGLRAAAWKKLKALEARLSEYEAQAMAQHAALEHGKHQAEKRNTDLEDKLQTLQAQLSTQDLELAELRVKSQAAAAHAASNSASGLKAQSNKDKEQEGLKAMQATTRMYCWLRLECEALKERLTESKQQVGRQQHALQQLRQQHQQRLEQVCEQRQRAVVEPAIQMQQHEGAALEKVSSIIALKLQLVGQLLDLVLQTGHLNSSHAGCCLQLPLAPLYFTCLGSQLVVQVLDDSSPGQAHLCRLLTQLAQERDHCQARLDQLQAQNDWKVDQLQQHVSGQQQECSHLKAQLRAAQKGERGEQRRQALAAAAKDAKLSQLRRNMQGLEAKLIHAMQSDAHRAETAAKSPAGERAVTGYNPEGAGGGQGAAIPRKAIDQKGGHLQGLQRLLEEEERSGRNLQQQLRQQLANAAATVPAQGPTADQQGQEAAQHQVAELQQQLAALEYKLQQAESSQGSVKQPLQEQQLPDNLSGKAPQKPVMADAVADASFRPHWQNPMAVHLSEAEKAEVQAGADAAANQNPADENSGTSEPACRASGLLQWEEKKKLQKRIDQLRAKLREKSVLVEQLQKEKQKKGEQVQQAHADLARQAALIKDLQAHARGKKELKEGGASLDQQVRELMLIDSLEEQRGALERQVATRQQPAAADQLAPPGSTTASDLPLQDQLLFKESELVEARLERSQAEAKAQRAQQRLDDILAQQPAPQVGSQRGGEGSKHGLVDTIQGLQRALERSRKECQAAVSSAKYMQLLEKKKELSKRCSVLEEEARIAAGIKEEAHRLEQRCQQMQGANAALKKQLKPLQEGHFQAKALSDQVEGLQAAVDSKDAELITLRKTLQHKEAQVEQLKVAEDAVDEGVAQEIAALRERLALIETENADMREELSAFDPAFFDEIEDLKYDHHQLQLQCTEYESIVRELSAQLGIDAAVLAKVAG